ncbi:MAG: hypothetical protein JWL64_512, partial [Frankiales bacterium]|nr:hypothetical protein [Frankiales bacterium]
LRAVPPPAGAPAVIDPGAARRLHLDVSRRLDGLLQGAHLGVGPGPGTEPAEARRYVPGDDVRRIDWAVTARTQETHVRDTVAERELETTLVVDLSGSMSFGTTHWLKRELAISAAAAFAHLTSGPGDRVGAVVISPRGTARIPPRSGRDATLALLHTLLATPRGHEAGPGLEVALRQVADPPRRRGMVVVVSDLLDRSAWQAPLTRLAQRHDLVVAEVIDPRELQLPELGLLRLVDPQTGRQVQVETRDARVRSRYAEAAAELRAAHVAICRAAGAGHVVLRTDSDWLLDLSAHLVRRRRTRGVVR